MKKLLLFLLFLNSFSVAFADSYSIDENSFKVVDGYVGIGTLAPRAKLDVDDGTTRLDTLGVGVTNTQALGWDTTDALISQYNLEDNTASTAVVDEEGLNNGTASGNTTTFTTTGKLGNGFNLASGRIVNLGSSLDVNGPFSWSLWINTTTSTLSYFISNRHGTSPNIGSYLQLGTDGKLSFTLDTGGSPIGTKCTTVVNDGNWRHVVGVYTGTQSLIYINSVLEGTPGAVTGDPSTGSATTYLGKADFSSGFLNPGKIDDVRFYNRALTQTEIDRIYNAGTGTTDTSGTFGGSTTKMMVQGDGTGTDKTIEVKDANGTANFFVQDNGRVAIGTTTPDQTLHVVGTVKATSFIGDGSGLTGVSGGSSQWQNGAVGINTTSPVGIGTVSPSSNLQVIGTVTATAFSGDGSGLTNISSAGGGWVDGGTNMYQSATTDNVGIGTITPNAATLEIVKNAAQAPFKISSAPLTNNGDYLTVSSSGNVGIGTITAAGRLFVVKNNNNFSVDNAGTTIVAGTNNLNGNGFSVNSASAVLTGASSTAGSSLVITGGGSTTSALHLKSTSGSGTGDEISFRTGNNVRAITINTNQNVGIGTSNPGQILDINGTSSKIRMRSPNGTVWNCQPADTTGAFTCT